MDIVLLTGPEVTSLAFRSFRRKIPDVFTHVAVDLPTVKEEDVSHTFFDSIALSTSRSEWAKSFLILEAWRLTAYDRVIVLETGTLLSQNIDELFGCPSSLVLGVPSNQEALGPTLLVLSPSMETYRDMLEVISQANFGEEKGWEEEGCGYGLNGAMQIETQRKKGKKTVTFQAHQGDYSIFRRNARLSDQPYLHDFSQPLCQFATSFTFPLLPFFLFLFFEGIDSFFRSRSVYGLGYVYYYHHHRTHNMRYLDPCVYGFSDLFPHCEQLSLSHIKVISSCWKFDEQLCIDYRKILSLLETYHRESDLNLSRYGISAGKMKPEFALRHRIQGSESIKSDL